MRARSSLSTARSSSTQGASRLSWPAAVARHLRAPVAVLRCARIALVVGTLLSLVNQGGVLLAGDLSVALGVKLGLNFLIPFSVSSLGYITASHAAAESGGDGESAHREPPGDADPD